MKRLRGFGQVLVGVAIVGGLFVAFHPAVDHAGAGALVAAVIIVLLLGAWLTIAIIVALSLVCNGLFRLWTGRDLINFDKAERKFPKENDDE